MNPRPRHYEKCEGTSRPHEGATAFYIVGANERHEALSKGGHNTAAYGASREQAPTVVSDPRPIHTEHGSAGHYPGWLLPAYRGDAAYELARVALAYCAADIVVLAIAVGFTLAGAR